MIENKEKLTDLAIFFHDKVRMLKVGGTVTIPLTKFSAEDIRQYMWGYAMFKKKWFEARHDKTANVLRVERVDVPEFGRGDIDVALGNTAVLTGEEEA